MKCEQVREQLPDYLASESCEQTEIERHLETCPWCREEAAMWERLESIPDEQPDPSLRARFDAMLTAYREGAEQARPAPRSGGLAGWIAGWWPRQPVWQMALALVLMAAGIFAGRNLGARNEEIATLRDEVHRTSQMVALSLLQQQSASERLRGVTWTERVNQPDREVLAALLTTLQYDTSVDVRLAAVDALRRYSSVPEVRRGAAGALEKQDSPLVQIALIDLLADMRERSSLPALQKLRQAAPEDVVRQRAAAAIERLP